jgi:hypothetical protein
MKQEVERFKAFVAANPTAVERGLTPEGKVIRQPRSRQRAVAA